MHGCMCTISSARVYKRHPAGVGPFLHPWGTELMFYRLEHLTKPTLNYKFFL